MRDKTKEAERLAIKPRVTATEVARRAGVSQSAVSRVFTPGASVSDETARKVREAAAALNYRPNVLARTLMTGRSRIVGLLVAYIDNQFYPRALEQLSNALQARGYHVLVFMTSKTAENVDRTVEEILDYQVDGIIMASVSMSSDIAARCEGAGVPVVLFNRTHGDNGASSVTSDNFVGGRRVAGLFAAVGARHIAYIAGSEGASTQRDREAGFLAGLAAADLECRTRAAGDYSYERARDATLEIFARADRPDAVFVANDHMAFAVMDALRFTLGRAIPGEVSVVGYDDVPLARWPAYDLTTVRQPLSLMVDECVRNLLARMTDAGVPPSRIAVDGKLILRGSARLPDGWTRTEETGSPEPQTHPERTGP